MEKTSSRTKCQEICNHLKRKKKRTKLSCLRATPVNALRASLRNAFAIILVFFRCCCVLRVEYVPLPFRLYTEINLSLLSAFDGDETLFPSEKGKGGRVYLPFCTRERVQDETRVFFLFFSSLDEMMDLCFFVFGQFMVYYLCFIHPFLRET